MDHVLFIASGFGIVIAVLTALWGVCALVGVGFTARRGQPTFEEDRQHKALDQKIPPQHVAAITAALAQVMDGPYRVVSVSAPAHRSFVGSALPRQQKHLAQQRSTSRIRTTSSTLPWSLPPPQWPLL